ncbi:hypothetical protein MMC14_004057 [Varicellaria rhodocarpa]|nr:hypothetical protein [Varicellaria rhodocarpa]
MTNCYNLGYRSISLQEVAQNTENRHSWNSDSKLRHTQVHFVSGSESQPVQPTESVNSKSNLPLSEEEHYKGIVTHAPEQSVANLSIKPHVNNSGSDSRYNSFGAFEPHNLISDNEEVPNIGAVGHSDEIFVQDIKGFSQPIRTGLSFPSIMRSPSPAASDSSGEVILFGGRGKNQLEFGIHPGSTVNLEIEQIGIHNSPTMRPCQIRSSSSSVSRASEPGLESRVSPLGSSSNLEFSESPLQIGNTRACRSGLASNLINRLELPPQRSWNKYGDEILADYIANAKAHEDVDELCPDADQALNQRDLGGSEGDIWLDETESSDHEILTSPMRNKTIGGWNKTNFHDFDGLSTSDEATGNVSCVLSKRIRPSGIQFLIVREGQTPDDARWILSSSLNMPGVIQKVRAFDKIEEVANDCLDMKTSLDTSPSSNQVAFDLQDDLDDMLDEEEFLIRRKERMTDEQIARLLSKQEELGLGSDEILLYDGDDSIKVSDDDNETLEPPLSAQLGRKKARTRESDQFHGYIDTLAAAIAIDPYNGFDILDQHRPSLMRKSKGRKKIVQTEMLDTELDETMQLAWEQDRKKKSLRKQQRGELRSQGVLGRNDKLDLKTKYVEGMTPTEVKNEIKEFLISTSEQWVNNNESKSLYADSFSLSLPPMDKEKRKLVHCIANGFNLESKSVGGGRSRFPVLYKTSRSQTYSEGTIDAIEARMSQTFFPRMDKGSVKGHSTVRKAFRMRNGGAAASYHDGEVVGATAPELGTENRGRAILEKMGWSTGTALGALNNKGIMQPVAHVVKTTKAGLG